MNHDPDVLVALAEIQASQSRIEERLDRVELALASRGSLSPRDRTALERLLPLIASRVGDAVFSVASLRRAVVEANDAALAAALDACGSQRAVGKLFARAEGQGVGGYAVRRIGGRIWAISNAL